MLFLVVDDDLLDVVGEQITRRLQDQVELGVGSRLFGDQNGEDADHHGQEAVGDQPDIRQLHG